MKFIQVGVGGFGRRWVDILKQNLEVEVVGMVDVSEQALDAACEAGGYGKEICFSSLEAALERVQADAIVSATPPKYHRHDVVTALQAGLHAISEKPMADSLDDCKAMLRAAAETGKTYVVSQNYRYSPVMWTFGQVVRSGQLGVIGQGKLDFFMGVDFGGGFRHEMQYPLVVDMSIHHFDLIRFTTGLDAVTVQGEAWNPSWSNYAGDCSCALVFAMNNGARILYNGSWCAKGQFNDWNGNWQLEGERGTVTYSNGEITRYDIPQLYKVEHKEAVEPAPPVYEHQHYVLNDFLEAIRTGRRPATDVYDNIRSVAMVFAAVEAMRTGKKVPVLDAEIRELLAGK